MPPGVSIGGVAVGGLSADEALRAVRARAVAPLGQVELELTGEPGFPVQVATSELAPLPRAKAAVDEAVRRPSLLDRVRAEVGLARERDIPLRYRVTSARAREVAARIEAQIDAPARPASLAVRDGRVVARPARAGRGVDTARLTALIGRLPERAVVPVTVVDPAVSDAQAERARLRAERIAATPAVVRGGGRRAVVRRPQLLEALRFTPTADRIVVSLAPGVIAGAVRPAFEGILRPAESAGFAVEGARVSVTPSSPGRDLDEEELARRVARRTGSAPVRGAHRGAEPGPHHRAGRGPRHSRAGQHLHHALRLLPAPGHQHPPGGAHPRPHPDPGGRHLLAQRRARRAHPGPRIRAGPADQRRRAGGRGRRRCQPGVDHHLQRGLLRGLRARLAHAARVLDHPLPAGPRGHRVVGRARVDRARTTGRRPR